jgi:multiphosphoryl transfer protein
MKSWTAIIRNVTGLHARPARVLVDTAKRFVSDIRIQHGASTGNAKSLISVLKLGVKPNTEITVLINGQDEGEASRALETLIADGLGEHHPVNGSSNGAQASRATTPVIPGPAANSALVRGVAAAPGHAIGPAFLFQSDVLTVSTEFAGVEPERARLRDAVARAQADLDALRARLTGEQAAIVEAHSELLSDPELLQDVDAAIVAGQGAGRAWEQVTQARAAELAQLSDPLLAARSADVRDVRDRVLRALSGAADPALALPAQPAIVVARDLAPSTLAAFDQTRLLGIVTSEGGPTAHTAIIARGLGIPAVVAAGDRVLGVAPGTLLTLDGEAGMVNLAPDQAAMQVAQERASTWSVRKQRATQHADLAAITQDGVCIEIAANAGGVADAQAAFAAGADAIGLLRTEFLFLDHASEPDEDTQYVIYRDVLSAMQGRPVIMRTLDIGGDKPVSYLDMPHEQNPFLGVRGLRLALNRPELLKRQLRALYRAAKDFPAGALRIMAPMVSDLGEWRAFRAIAEAVRVETGAQPVDLGIMIEVPAAALMADVFAPEVAFFSIGTNDLTQYTLAADRQHPRLAHLNDGLHPGVLRLVKNTVDAAERAGKWVGVCGELASDLHAVPILIGLGVRELSVTPPALALVKDAVRSQTLADARQLADRALKCATAAEVRSLNG